MKKLLVTAALGASFTSAPALAQGMQQRDQTRAEAQQRADLLFQMIDANKDGTITRAEADQAMAEFQASRGGDDSGHGHGGRMQRMIDQAFAKSSSLTLQQYEAQALARFDAADLNHDGIVSVAEREQARQQHPAQATAAAPAPQAPPAKPQ